MLRSKARVSLQVWMALFKDAGVVAIEPWTSVTGEPLLELALRDENPYGNPLCFRQGP
jgi:hypothetical protein